MNTKYTAIVLSILGIGTIAGSVNAQTAAKDTLLNRQVSLERAYTPTIQDASKINTLPSLHEPAKKQYDIRFEQAAPTVNFDKYPIGDPGSGDIRTNIDFSKQRGYFTFGAGMYSNLEGALGYRIVDGEKDQFDIFGTHNSTNGKIKYLQGSKDEVKAKNMENFIKAKFSHKFDAATWFLNASFLNNGFNYYGYPSMTLEPPMKEYDFNKNQSVNIFEVETGLQSPESSNNLTYSGSIKYNRFSSKYGTQIEFDGPKGNIIDANVNLASPFATDKKVGIKGGLFFQKYDEHKNLYSGSVQNDLYHNLTVVKANPYFTLEDGDIRLLVGANINWAIDKSNKFVVAPTIDLKWNFEEKSLAYLTVDGGVNNNSFIDVFNESRYIMPIERVDISKTLYDAQIGVRSGVISGFEFDIFGGYKYTQNDHFFVQTPMGIWANVSVPIYANLGSGHFGGAIKTKLIPYTDLSLKAVSHFHNVSKYTSTNSDLKIEKEAWGEPTFTVDLNADFSFIENLTLTANYQLQTGRKALNFGKIEDMKNINEVNIRANYHVLEWFSIYVKANNVLNQKYERYYGYTLQGINAVAGFNLTF